MHLLLDSALCTGRSELYIRQNLVETEGSCFVKSGKRCRSLHEQSLKATL